MFKVYRSFGRFILIASGEILNVFFGGLGSPPSHTSAIILDDQKRYRIKCNNPKRIEKYNIEVNLSGEIIHPRKNVADRGYEDFTRFKTFLYNRAFTHQLKLYPEKTILMNIVVWIKETWTSLAMFNHYTAQCKFKKISDSRVEALPLIILNYYKFVYGLITTLSPSIPRKVISFMLIIAH